MELSHNSDKKIKSSSKYNWRKSQITKNGIQYLLNACNLIYSKLPY